MRALGCPLFALTLTLAASVCNPPAIAQTSDLARDHARSCDWDAEGPPNKKLEACTAMIDSGKYAGNDLADIVLMRARVYEYNVLDAIRALADYAWTIRLNPDYAAAYYYRSRLHERRGDAKLALADLNKAIELHPDDEGPLYSTRGRLHAKLNNVDEAIADFDQALRLAPDDSDTRYRRAILKQKRGDLEGSKADLAWLSRQLGSVVRLPDPK